MSFPPPLQSGFSVSPRLADCALAGWPAPARAALPAVSMGDEAVERTSRDPIKGHAALPTESQGRGGIMCTLLRPVKVHACQRPRGSARPDSNARAAWRLRCTASAPRSPGRASRRATESERELRGLLLGPTDNLRAPTPRKSRTLIAGFDEATKRRVLG